MVFTRVIGWIASRIYAMKRVNVTYNIIHERVVKLMSYISFFNSLEEDQTWCVDRPTSEIEIPQDFADFIIPNSVRIRDDRLYPDLLARGNSQYLHNVIPGGDKAKPRIKASDISQADLIDIIVDESETAENEISQFNETNITAKNFNYSDYLNNVYSLYQIMKIRPSFVSLNSLKRNVLLSDVLDKVEVNKRLSAGSPVVPLNLKVGMKPLMGIEIQTTPTLKVLENYILRMFKDV